MSQIEHILACRFCGFEFQEAPEMVNKMMRLHQEAEHRSEARDPTIRVADLVSIVRLTKTRARCAFNECFDRADKKDAGPFCVRHTAIMSAIRDEARLVESGLHVSSLPYCLIPDPAICSAQAHYLRRAVALRKTFRALLSVSARTSRPGHDRWIRMLEKCLADRLAYIAAARDQPIQQYRHRNYTK
jgi:hypothetical protein